jgi:hypothetical protein
MINLTDILAFKLYGFFNKFKELNKTQKKKILTALLRSIYLLEELILFLIALKNVFKLE